MKEDTKIAVTAAVNNISLSFGTLVQQIEKFAEDISDVESAKLFNFLRGSLHTIQTNTDLVRKNAVVTRGTFSFDSEEIAPATRVTPATAPVTGPAPTKPATTRPTRAPRISAHSPDDHPDLETAPVYPNKTTDRTERDIGFLDD